MDGQKEPSNNSAQAYAQVSENLTNPKVPVVPNSCYQVTE